MGATNCPNCGAPIAGDTCDYCGTVVVDMACMDLDKPFWMKVRANGKVCMYRCMFESFEVVRQNDRLYADSLVFAPLFVGETLRFEMSVVPDKRGVTKIIADSGTTSSKEELYERKYF